jgi:hypothetical protein
MYAGGLIIFSAQYLTWSTLKSSGRDKNSIAIILKATAALSALYLHGKQAAELRLAHL